MIEKEIDNVDYYYPKNVHHHFYSMDLMYPIDFVDFDHVHLIHHVVHHH
jgi:hypothetical protein